MNQMPWPEEALNIIVAPDMHLRGDRPRCRTDGGLQASPEQASITWMETQEKVLAEIADIANRNSADVLIPGDLLHTPTVPNRTISMFIRFVQKVNRRVYLLAGNHDLPYHSWDNVESSSFGILAQIMAEKGGLISDPSGLGVGWCHFGEEHNRNSDLEIQVIHELVFPSTKDLPPNTNATTASELLERFPKARLIITGDYHHHFIYRERGEFPRFVVNNGCITRQAADFKNYEPCVTHIYADLGINLIEINPIFLKSDSPKTAPEIVNDSYLVEDEARDERIASFVEQIRTSGKMSLSFEENVEAALTRSEYDDDFKIEVRRLLSGSNAEA